MQIKIPYLDLCGTLTLSLLAGTSAMLITFATVWTPIRTDRGLVLIWIKTFHHSDSVPVGIF